MGARGSSDAKDPQPVPVGDLWKLQRAGALTRPAGCELPELDYALLMLAEFANLVGG